MTKPLYYRVDIENKGSQMILVDPFQITEGSASMVDVSKLYPNTHSGIAPFYTPPFRTVTIAWRVSTTGAIGQAQVQLNLPKEFTKEKGSCIDFYIYPEEQRVEVAYDIVDPKTGQINTVR